MGNTPLCVRLGDASVLMTKLWSACTIQRSLDNVIYRSRVIRRLALGLTRRSPRGSEAAATPRSLAKVLVPWPMAILVVSRKGRRHGSCAHAGAVSCCGRTHVELLR
eukprot:4874556-Pyramimonas_sp.AAC.1